MNRIQAFPISTSHPPGAAMPIACFGEAGMHTCPDRAGRLPLAAGLFGMIAVPDCRTDILPARIGAGRS